MAKLPAKKIAKKAAPKKAAAPKTSVKKVAIKKVAIKKTAAKKTAVKKTIEKAPPAKKAAVKKTAVKTIKEVKVIEPGMLLALTVAQGMYERKAENIRILDMRKIAGASSDFFVISHASNDKQVDAIGKSVEEEVKKTLNENPLHREGFENLEWVLLDYFNVVAHVFQEEKREFYSIEQLWGDAEEVVFKGK